MGQVQTKLVKHRESGEEMVINASDFNESDHQEIKTDLDTNLVRRARSARTVEELDEIINDVRASDLRAKKRGASASEGNGDVLEYLTAKRRVLEMELGPKFIRPAPRPVVPTAVNTPYVPYMAPASPGHALRTHGVDPALQTELGETLRSEHTGVSSVEHVGSDDTRDPKGTGADVSALVEQSGATVPDLSTLTVADAKDVIDQADTKTLDAFEKAESKGAGRVGIQNAIDKRREALKASE